MPQIEVFFSEKCWACHEAINWFRNQGHECKALEVKWQGEELLDDENGRELKRRLGQVEFVPQIFINGRHLGGWTRLSELIESGAIRDYLDNR